VSEVHVLRRPFVVGAVVLALSAGPALAASLAPGRPGPNIRPFFDVGYSRPVRYGNLDHGFGLGFGFGVEQSSRWSTLFRFEWDALLESERPGDYFDYGPSSVGVSAISWSLGAQLHLRTRGAVRPYTEALLGVRLNTEGGGGVVVSSASGGGPEGNGVSASLRLGLTTAKPGGAGLFLDSGMDIMVRNPDRFGIVPIRLGIVFP